MSNCMLDDVLGIQDALEKERKKKDLFLFVFKIETKE